MPPTTRSTSTSKAKAVLDMPSSTPPALVPSVDISPNSTSDVAPSLVPFEARLEVLMTTIASNQDTIKAFAAHLERNQASLDKNSSDIITLGEKFDDLQSTVTNKISTDIQVAIDSVITDIRSDFTKSFQALSTSIEQDLSH